MGTPNRYGEEHIRPDYYEDEAGMRHSYVDNLDESVDWSHDTRSEAFLEKHKRSDVRIYEEVCMALLGNSSLDASNIGVKVENGIVTLEGKAKGRIEKRMAEMISHDVPGVLNVRNEIVIS